MFTPKPMPTAQITTHERPAPHRGDHHRDDQDGERDQDVDEHRDGLAHPAGGERAERGERDADDRGDDAGPDGHEDRRARAGHEQAQDVAPGAVGAEQVRPARAAPSGRRCRRCCGSNGVQNSETSAVSTTIATTIRPKRPVDSATVRPRRCHDVAARAHVRLGRCRSRRLPLPRVDHAVHEVDDEADDQHEPGQHEQLALHLGQIARCRRRPPASVRCPGSVKSCSMTTEPTMIPATCRPRTVMTDSPTFGRPWRISAGVAGEPLRGGGAHEVLPDRLQRRAADEAHAASRPRRCRSSGRGAAASGTPRPGSSHPARGKPCAGSQPSHTAKTTTSIMPAQTTGTAASACAPTLSAVPPRASAAHGREHAERHAEQHGDRAVP